MGATDRYSRSDTCAASSITISFGVNPRDDFGLSVFAFTSDPFPHASSVWLSRIKGTGHPSASFISRTYCSNSFDWSSVGAKMSVFRRGMVRDRATMRLATVYGPSQIPEALAMVLGE